MRYSAALLELISPGGETMRRWQSRWQRATVAWETQAWEYCPFGWSGIVAGGSTETATTALSFPRTPSIEGVLRLAQRQGWTARLRVYHYAESLDGASPPAGMILMGTFRGALEVAGAKPTEISASITGLQSSGSYQFPPRVADSAMIGVPCVLS